MRVGLQFGLALVLGSLCLRGCGQAGGPGEEGLVRHVTRDVFLPRPFVLTAWRGRERPISWYKEDDRHLVVATERYVLRLVDGDALWVVRVPSKAKGPSDLQPSTKACRGADGVIWVVHWPPRGGEYDPVEPRMTFCALSRDTGRVLAKSDFVVPSTISPDVVSMIARDQDCLVFLGDTRNLSHAEVEAVACVSCVRGAVRIALDDPLSLVGWICADSRSTPAGDSLVFTRSSPDGAISIKVVRTDPLPSRSITVHGLPESSFRSGALDLMADDVLLSSMGKFREKGRGVSFDLRTGEARWHQWTPYAADSWGSAFVDRGKAYVSLYVAEDSEHIIYMVDCNSGEATPLITENDFRLNGRIGFGPTLIAREGEILFATDSATKRHDEVKHNVYALKLSDKSVRLVETVHIKGDPDEGLMGGDIRFLLPAARGYWLGSGCGAIAYREYESPQAQKKIQVQAEAKAVPGPIAAAQLHQRVQALVRKLNAPDRKERLAAIEALSEMGAEAQEALSAIIPLLADKDAGVRHGAGYALLDICPSVEALRQVIPVMVQTLNDKTKDADTRALAAEEIGELPGLAAEAAEPLISATEDAEAVVRRAAVEALGNVKASPQRSIPALVSALGDKDDSVRADAAFALAQYGPAAKEASAALTRALEDSSEHVRSQAAYALREIGAAGGAPTPDVLRMLTDRSADVRREALVILWNTGSASEEEVQAVMKALSDGDELVRWVAAETLGRLGPSAQGAVPALMALLNSSDRTLRWGAVEALGRIGPAAQEAIPALLDGFMTDTAERGRVGRALGMMGPAAKSAVPALIQALNGKEIGLRSMAAAALGEIGQYATDAQPELIKALKDPEASVRWQAAQALGRLPPSEAAAAALGPMLSDKNRDVRLRAADAIAKMGPFAAKAHEDLLQALKGNDRYVRSSVAEALAKSGRADVGVPVLIEGLKDVQVGMWAAEALGEIGAPARQALPALLEAMKGDNDNLRRAAALAVVRLGETDNGLPILIKALKHEVPDTRAYTAEVLGQVGPPAKKAVGALREAMKDESPAVRKAAAEALRKIEHDGK